MTSKQQLQNKSEKLKFFNLKEIKEIVYTTALDSTGHGILHMFKRENRAIKFIWVFCFLVSAGWMIFMITATIQTYLRWDTVIKTETILEIPSKFPSISICNTSPYGTIYSDAFVQQILDQSNLTRQNFFDIYFSFPILELKYIIGLNVLSSYFTDAQKKTMSPQLEDMLLDCHFNLESCSVDDFSWYGRVSLL